MASDRLTAKQEAFAQGVADGLTLADAYRRAYDVSRSTDKSVWEAAARLMADDKVSARVDFLRAKLAEMALWTREQSVAVLSEVAQEGEKDADRVRAVAELNAMHGYDAPKKVDLTNSDGSLRPTVIQIVAKR
jgi:hypothetical protein